MKKLTQKQINLLVEAMRRWVTFHENTPGRTLTSAWTGLGYATEYRRVTSTRLMEPVTGGGKGCLNWYRLTPAGAAIVQKWLETGIGRSDFRDFDFISWNKINQLLEYSDLTTAQ